MSTVWSRSSTLTTVVSGLTFNGCSRALTTRAAAAGPMLATHTAPVGARM